VVVIWWTLWLFSVTAPCSTSDMVPAFGHVRWYRLIVTDSSACKDAWLDICRLALIALDQGFSNFFSPWTPLQIMWYSRTTDATWFTNPKYSMHSHRQGVRGGSRPKILGGIVPQLLHHWVHFLRSPKPKKIRTSSRPTFEIYHQ